MLYDYLPGYKYFRAMSRFMALASLFLAMLAAIGFDRLRHAESRPGRLAWVPAVAGLAVVSLGALIWFTRDTGGGGVWGMLLKVVDGSGQMYARGMKAGRSGTPIERAAFTALVLLGSGGLFLMVSALLAGMNRYRFLVYGVAGLLVVELLITARTSVCSLPVPLQMPEQYYRALRTTPPPQRTWQTVWQYPNFAMGQKRLEANGYDPAKLARFEAFLEEVADGKPWYEREAEQALTNYPRLAEMLRVRKFMVRGKPWVREAEREPMPRVALVHEYELAAGRTEAFAILKSADFEPRRRVVLETDPGIRPEPAAEPGSVSIVRDRIDEIEITASTSVPAILLMTDAYSHGWHARALAGSAQGEYQVMPANWILRAIPLSAGEHRILLRYRPRHYTLGLWISLATMAGCMVAAGVVAVRTVRQHKES